MEIKRKKYIPPHVESVECYPSHVLALSIIYDGEADPDADILTKDNIWDFNQGEYSYGESLFD